MMLLQKLDNYDAYNFILVNTISIVASVHFIYLNIFHPKAR